jgi:hypothetical protein
MLPLVSEGSDAVLVSQANVSEPFHSCPAVLFYARPTDTQFDREGTRQHKYVLIMAAIVGVTWAACFVTHMSLCQPLRKNWQVKPYAGG